ncbi:Hypothetical predicted protein [Paramuricea clavata]|uniref:Uncharacterized protein n=1 Tax=Paramuricea clavata TaxID=317549 RepID=A0A6S7GX87_PARCT|nr:Hypothetical predicted protein [Paramuricea clavata]
MTRSGAGACSLPTCRYFQNLLFLKDKIANKETESNVSLSNQRHAVSLEDSIIQNMGALSQQQSIRTPNTRPGTEQHAPLLSTTTVSNSTQKQVPTTSSTQQLNRSAPFAPTPDKRKSGSNELFSGTPKQKKAAREELSNTVDLLTLKHLDNFSSAEKELLKSINRKF